MGRMMCEGLVRRVFCFSVLGGWVRLVALMRQHLKVLLSFGLVVSALFVPVMGHAAEVHWVEVKSEHFTVMTDANERQGRRIASQFERMRSVFHTLFPTSTYDNGASIVVLALKDKKSFQTLEPAAYLAKGQLDLAGYFMRSPDKNYVLLRLDTEGEHPFSTVYHEYTHYMTAKSAEWMPLWMSEGLAEFYQNTDIEDKDVLLGQPSADDILFLRQQRLLPLTTLLKVDHTSPYYHDEQKGSVFYSESWALTHFILLADNEKGTHRMIDYAKFLIAGEDGVTAAQHAFGDLNQLQKALDNYVAQQSFRYFKMKTVVTADETKFVVRVMPTPEANAIRADVLVYNQRQSDAQVLLDAVLRDDPKNAQARETMGYMRFRDGDIPGARKWYGEAVQLDSKSFLAHYYFAVMSLQSGDRDHDEAVEASLKSAIAMNKQFAPAYDTLAMFYARQGEKFSEAHMLNLQAVQLEPENLRFRMNAAQVLAMQQQWEPALGVLKVAARMAKTPTETYSVQSQIDQVERMQTMMARGGQMRSSRGPVARSERTGTPTTEVETKVTVIDSQTAARRVMPVEVSAAVEEQHYPAAADGPKRKVKGVLRGVTCSYPSVLTLRVEQAGKVVTLYSNNYYKIAFTLGNYDSKEDIQPCKGIEGMKANVEYAEVQDAKVAGQIVSIELNK